MENSKIGWTDHTWNPVTGCEKVSEGCANCYAETWSRKTEGRVKWGPGQERVRTKPANWLKVRKWNHDAKSRPIWLPRPRVFMASLADWLDTDIDLQTFVDLLDAIRTADSLSWLCLTKRPQNWLKRIEQAREAASVANNQGLENWLTDWLAGVAPINVWMGTTTENQKRYDERVPILRSIPARIRFLSVEPQLTYVGHRQPDGIDWIISGGESGPNRRPFDVRWAEDLADRCTEVRIPFFMKQDAHLREGQQGRIPDRLWARKEWPADPV